MVRSASSRVSNHEGPDVARGHPSRRAQKRAPQDAVGGAARQIVGWVERLRPPKLQRATAEAKPIATTRKMMGFASLYPSYNPERRPSFRYTETTGFCSSAYL